MNFSDIIAATRNSIYSFSFFGPNKGNNALATIKDVTNLTDQLNNMFPYRFFDVQLNQVGTDAPIVQRLAAGAGECMRNCSSDCALCDCIKSCSNETTSISIQDAIMGSARTGVGTYMFTFNMPAEYVAKYARAASIKNISFAFTPFSDIAHQVTVTQIPTGVANLNQYEVKTYNAGVLADGILNHTVVSMKIFFN